MIGRLLIATNNSGKLKEVEELLADTGLEVLSPDDFPDQLKGFDVDESGSTFAENAQLKAVGFAQRIGVPVLADDSGLEVFALGMKPGVKSNRWMEGSSEDRNLAVLELMKNQTDRRAQFVSIICWFNPDTQNKVFFEGKVHGTIALEAKGENGFGYDPICIPDGHHQSFAQLGTEIKNQISHRARALAKFKEFLKVQQDN